MSTCFQKNNICFVLTITTAKLIVYRAHARLCGTSTIGRAVCARAIKHLTRCYRALSLLNCVNSVCLKSLCSLWKIKVLQVELRLEIRLKMRHTVDACSRIQTTMADCYHALIRNEKKNSALYTIQVLKTKASCVLFLCVWLGN